MATKRKVPQTLEKEIEQKEVAREKEVDNTVYPAYNGGIAEFDTALLKIAGTCNYELKKKIARANGIEDYRALNSQNITLLNLAKSGRLKKPM